MRRLLSGVATALKWALIAFVFLYLALVLVNLRDEEPSAQARALAQYHQPPVTDASNAYLALVGFDAPAGADPVDEGARLIAEHRVAATGDPWGRERLANRAAEKPRIAVIGGLGWAGGALPLPEAFDPAYLEQARAHARDVQLLLSANHALVARYRRLLELPDFSDTAEPDILAPTILSGSHARIRRLLLAQCAIDAQSGSVDRALEFLAADIGLWRRILAGNGTLVDEMLAIRSVASDLHVISDLLAMGDFDVARHGTALLQIARPLSAAEMDFGPMYAKEFAATAALLEGMRIEGQRRKAEGWLQRLGYTMFFEPFFKINASRNLWARLFSANQALSGTSPREFLVAKIAADQEAQALAQVRIGWLYNPTGHILAGVATPAYPSYAARVMDLAAYVNLVRAQLEWRLAMAETKAVPVTVGGAGIESRNPYTEQTFDWDATARILSFVPGSDPWKQWGTAAAIPVMGDGRRTQGR